VTKKILPKKKLGPIFKELKNFLPKKLSLVTKLSKIWVCDTGSGGIRKKPTPDPGSRIPDQESRIQGSKRHWISDPGSGSATLQIRGWGLVQDVPREFP
jgi:hypothetical protein